ncbi:hypothetical protein JTB14_008415 [Gonioctena quinquepunctata]|nr:hypothetical protein JTB14_008415 [Gonioctena quinquepunctata]
MDNSVVTVASTSASVQPEGTVERYCQKERKHVMIPRPEFVAAYNRNMGGTDLMEQGIANYRINIRGKKWYWPIFTWLIDVAVHNAWYLSRKNVKSPALNFRREIAQVYLTKYKTPIKAPGRIGLTKNIIPDIRFDRMDICINWFASYHTK